MSILSVALDNGKNSTWLTLPATGAELHKALLDMGALDKPYSIGDYRTTISVPHEIMRDIIVGSDINAANYLAARLAGLPPVQIEKLEAVMDSPQHLTSIAQLIDFADNTDCFVFTPGIGSTEELGRYVLHESGEVDVTEEWKSGIAPEAFGKRIVEVEKGVFTSRGYLQPTGDEWTKIFEKNAVIPPEYRIENYMAAAEMAVEQNYNQIDGTINNEPPHRADLTDGQTHDEIAELVPETLPENGLLSFDDFVIKCRIMDEACRQWCDFIDEAPERRDGLLFTEFFKDICQQKYQEYLDDPAYRDDSDYYASLPDDVKYNMAVHKAIAASQEAKPPKQTKKPSILEQLKEATEEAAKSGPAPVKRPKDIDR